ncbi:NAD-dependent epimerase/dehydratase family protein, partial [Nostoc sp. NIES-2111]
MRLTKRLSVHLAGIAAAALLASAASAADFHGFDASKHDMGGDIVPWFVDRSESAVYDFKNNDVPGSYERDRDYWRGVRTMKSYFDAHMDLVAPLPEFNLYNSAWPIFTSYGALPPAKLVEGDIGDEALLDRVMSQHRFDAVVHFAGSIVVPDSVKDPLGYYLNNTVKSRMLMACAVKAGIPRFIFSSTAAVYGNVSAEPVFEDRAPAPVSPYGTSKLMTEQMLKDSAIAYGLQYVALRYFNVAGADPKGRIGQSTPRATHLIKVACQAALGQRDGLE